MTKEEQAFAAIRKSYWTKDRMVAFAVDLLRNHKDAFEPEKALDQLHTTWGNDAVRAYKKFVSNVPPEIVDRKISDWVRNDQIGYTANSLRAIASHLIANGEPLPEPLREWVIDALKNSVKRRGKKGRNRDALVLRDLEITFVTPMLSLCGLKHTRNKATKSVESCCSIMAEALAQLGHPMSEDAVEKIVQRTHRRWKLSAS